MALIDDLRAGSVQFRSATVEDVDGPKGEILMKAVPYGIPTDIGGDITEEFKPGAFARSAKSPQRLTLWSGHGGPVIGRGVEASSKQDGLWLRMKVGRTSAAQDAILNLEDGIQSDPSVEFRPMADFMRVEQRTDGGLTVTHRRAHLLGVALVTDGAYHGEAFVEAVRESQQERAIEEAKLWFEAWRKR